MYGLFFSCENFDSNANFSIMIFKSLRFLSYIFFSRKAFLFCKTICKGNFSGKQFPDLSRLFIESCKTMSSCEKLKKCYCIIIHYFKLLANFLKRFLLPQKASFWFYKVSIKKVHETLRHSEK